MATLEGLLERSVKLPATIEESGRLFRTAEPFPHLVFTDLFPDVMLQGILNEMSLLDPEDWHLFDEGNLLKFNSRSPLSFGPTTAALSAFLHSALFLSFVSELTGVSGLLPDPYMYGGGYHAVPRGGRFDIHTDSNIHPLTGLRRRFAFIVFLNHDWKQEYNGDLELWDSPTGAKRVSIQPRFNNAVLFESSDRSFHGYPTTVNCPAGAFRRSFMTYFYTNDGALEPVHSTIYAPPFSRRKTFDYYLRRCLPPVLYNSLIARGLSKRRITVKSKLRRKAADVG